MSSSQKVIVQKFNAGPLLQDKEEPVDKAYFSTYRTILRSRVASDNVESQTFVSGIRKVPKFRTGELEDDDEDKYVHPKFNQKPKLGSSSHEPSSQHINKQSSQDPSIVEKEETNKKPVIPVIRKKPRLLGGPLEDDESANIGMSTVLDKSKKKNKGKEANQTAEQSIKDHINLRPEITPQGFRKKPKCLGGPLEDDVDIPNQVEIDHFAVRSQSQGVIQVRMNPKYLGGPLENEAFEAADLNKTLMRTQSQSQSDLIENSKDNPKVIPIQIKPRFRGGIIEDDYELESKKQALQRQASEKPKKKKKVKGQENEDETSKLLKNSKDFPVILKKPQSLGGKIEDDADDEKEIDEVPIVVQKQSSRAELLENDMDDINKEKEEPEQGILADILTQKSEEEGEIEEYEEEEDRREEENSVNKVPAKIQFKTTPEEGTDVFNHEKTVRRFRKKKLTDVVEAKEEEEERNRSLSRNPSLARERNKSGSRDPNRVASRVLATTSNTASSDEKVRKPDSKDEFSPERPALDKPYPFDLKAVQSRYMLSKGKSKGDLDVNEKDDVALREYKRAKPKSKFDQENFEDDELERANLLEKKPNDDKKQKERPIAKNVLKKVAAEESKPDESKEPEVSYSTTIQKHKYLKAKSRNLDQEAGRKDNPTIQKESKEPEEPEVPYSTTIKTHKFLKAGSRAYGVLTKKERSPPKEPIQPTPAAENKPSVKRIPLKNKFGQYRTGKFQEVGHQTNAQENDDDQPLLKNADTADGKLKLEITKEEIAKALKKQPINQTGETRKIKSISISKPRTQSNLPTSGDDSEDNLWPKRQLGKMPAHKSISIGHKTPRERSGPLKDEETINFSISNLQTNNDFKNQSEDSELERVLSNPYKLTQPKSYKTSDDELGFENTKYSDSEIERSLLSSLNRKKTHSSLADIDTSTQLKGNYESKITKGLNISLPKFKSQKEIGTIELPPISGRGTTPKTSGLKSARSVSDLSWPLGSPEKAKHFDGNSIKEIQGTSLSNVDNFPSEKNNENPLELKKFKSMGIALKIPAQGQLDPIPDSEKVYPATARNRVIIRREINKKPLSKEAEDIQRTDQEKIKVDREVQNNLNEGVKRHFKIRTTSKDQLSLKSEISKDGKGSESPVQKQNQ